MNRKKAIRQLEGIKSECQSYSMIDRGYETKWQEDIAALDYAVRVLKSRTSSFLELLACVAVIVVLFGGLGWIATIVYR